MDIGMQGLLNQSIANMQSAKADQASEAVNKNKTMQDIDDASKEFEAVFVSQMLNHMFEGIETDGMFGGGHAEDIYRSMQIQEYGKIITQSGGIGVADAIKAEMIKLQEGQV